MEIKDQRTKSLLWLLLIILVGVLSGATAYLLAITEATAQKEDLQGQVNDLQRQLNGTNNTNGTTIEAPIDETADWQTYTNEEHGFSFKYPKEWERTDTGEGLIQLYNSEIRAGRSLLPSETKVVVDVVAQSDYMPDVKTAVERNIKEESLTITSDRDVVVGGISSKEIVTPSVMGGSITLVYIPRGDDYINIVWYSNTAQYTNVLSTFQFTN